MVKQGYKQTEIGVVPEDWEVFRLNEICSINPQRDKHLLTEFIYVDLESAVNGILKNKKIINRIKAPSRAQRQFKKNDILYQMVRPYQKNNLFINFEATQYIASTGYAVIRGLYGKSVSKYLYYYLHTDSFVNTVLNNCTGTSYPAINPIALSNIKIRIPPNINEQERIAEALSDVDELIFSLEKLIAKKKAIKQGTMQELLTGKKRLQGFSGKWKNIPLEEIGSLTGAGVDKKIIADELPITLLNYTNVYNQISIARNDLNHRVTASREKIKNCSIFKGDVFLTPTSETPEDIAVSAVASEDMPDVVYSYHVVRLRPHSYFNGNYINYTLLTPMFRKQAIRYAEGSGVRYVITLKKFKEMMLYIPTDKKEQDSIVSILSDMDNEIEVLEQKLAKTRQIKQGMMQQLLTGKIRLVEREPITDITAKQDKSPRTSHNHQFDDAVMIAAIVNSFYSEKYPLGRKKVQKLLYLLRRKQEADTSEFKKKAAGPYADEIRYKGGEPIAKKNGYISATTNTKGTSFSKGKKIDEALSYVEKWKMQLDIDWLVSNFKYVGVNDLELYATIDMAICDLKHSGIKVSVTTIKSLISDNDEWKNKLGKKYFSDENIEKAIKKCKDLFNM